MDYLFKYICTILVLMFVKKLVQNKIHLPSPIRDLLNVSNGDEINIEVITIGNSKIVTISKNYLKGVRVLNCRSKHVSEKVE